MKTNEILTPNQAVAREVKTWMARMDVKKVDLAHVFGISQAGVAKKLRGDSAFSFEDLLKVAGLMGISLNELLGESILNTKIPSSTENNEEGDKEEAPIGFIPNGASYDVVAGARFELATSGL